MKFEINKKEYKALLKGLYLASAVLKSYRPELAEKEIVQEKLLKKLLEKAKDFELDHWVRKTNNQETLFNEEKEFEIYESIQEYEALIFWNELSYRLAERDLEEVLSEEDILAMSVGEELDKELEIQEKYEEEFVENGLQNLRLIHPEMN